MDFNLRFDFRNPPMAGTSMADRYAAALDMVEWADGLGGTSINLAEHHGSADGYLPSPALMLGVMAQRTRSARLRWGALIAPFHHPLRIAEDLIVVDNLSKGRLEIVVAAGYAPGEFEMFGVPTSERVQRVTEMVHTLRAAFSGEPFEFRGRTVRVTPLPYQPGGPPILMGGGSEPAARRAARIGDGFVPNVPEAWQWYRDEMQQLGKGDPGPLPRRESATVVVWNDPDRGWELMAPYFMHEMTSYAEWLTSGHAEGPYHAVASLDELRASGRYRVVTPDQLTAELQAVANPEVRLHPLCGGIPPELGWESLRLFEREVLPAFGR